MHGHKFAAGAAGSYARSRVSTRPLRTDPAGSRRIGRWVRRIALASLLAGVLAYLPYRLLDPAGNAQIDGMRDELASVRAEIAALRDENAGLGADIRALKDDTGAVEDIARLDLGMVRPGELVIRVERSP